MPAMASMADYECNDTGALSAAELAEPAGGAGTCGHVKPGDTIEAHWVYSSCDVAPGPGLGSCLGKACANPDL